MSDIVIGSVIGSAVILTIIAVSAAAYDHAGRRYASGKAEAIDSPKSFGLVYRYIQASTLVMGLTAFWVEHPVVLAMPVDLLCVLLGSGVALAGLSLFVVAKATLGRHYSPCFDSLVPDGIVDVGVYRHVRHPIYTANFLIVGGLLVSTASLWLALNLGLLAVYYTRAAVTEEKALAARFEEYRGYMQRSGRFWPRHLFTSAATAYRRVGP